MMSNGKKLMLFSHVCNTRNITGAEKLLFFLARKLSLHFECTIVAPKEGRLTELVRGSGLRVIIMDTPLFYGMCSPYENIIHDAEEMSSTFATGKIVSLLRDESPDYVFVNTSVNIIPAIAAKSLGIPIVWHITEIIADNEFTHNSVSIIDKYSDWILGISETAVAPFRDHHLEEKVSLLYPSWDNGEFISSNWPFLRQRKRWEWGFGPEHTVIGYISSFLIKEKGTDHFIKSAVSMGMHYPNSRFVVIGGEVDKPYYRSLKQIVKDASLSKHFIFIDHEESIEAAYCAMDIVVIPSLKSEGFGMTAMEAMICGKPVVAYASGGLREILESTRSGRYLVPTGDIEELTAKISELIVSPELMVEIGSENQRQVEVMFGTSAFKEKLQNFVACILQLKGNTVPLPRAVVAIPLEENVAAANTSKRKKRERGRHLKRMRLKLRRRRSKKGRVIHALKATQRRSIRGSGKLTRARKRVRHRSVSNRKRRRSGRG